MGRYLKAMLLAIIVMASSFTEPLTFGSAQAGWGRDEQSCTAPWYWQGGQCVPEDLAPDIVVYGHNGFDNEFFYSYILPMYSPDQAQEFQFLPAKSDSSKRGQELNRRKRIHDCVANGLARGMEIDIPGLTAHREVTFEYQGLRARFDIVESISGFPTGVTEVKTVLDFEGAAEDLLVRNQPIVAEGIKNGQAIPYGANAALAGFVVGQPIGRPFPFAVAAVPILGNCNNS